MKDLPDLLHKLHKAFKDVDFFFFFFFTLVCNHFKPQTYSQGTYELAVIKTTTLTYVLKRYVFLDQWNICADMNFHSFERAKASYCQYCQLKLIRILLMLMLGTIIWADI